MQEIETLILSNFITVLLVGKHAHIYILQPHGCPTTSTMSPSLKENRTPLFQSLPCKMWMKHRTQKTPSSYNWERTWLSELEGVPVSLIHANCAQSSSFSQLFLNCEEEHDLTWTGERMVWERNHQSRRQGHTQVAFPMGWMRRTEERKTICSFTGQREVRYPKSVKVFVLLKMEGIQAI